MNQLTVPNKVVHQFQNAASGVHCHVYILDWYPSKIPAAAKEHDVLYWRPVHKIANSPSAPWFTSIPVGKNAPSQLMKTMCTQAKN